MVVAIDLLWVPMTKKGRGLVWSSREIRRTRRQLKRGVKRINNDTEKSWTSFRSDSGGDVIWAIIAGGNAQKIAFFLRRMSLGGGSSSVRRLWRERSQHRRGRIICIDSKVYLNKMLSCQQGSRSCVRAHKAFAENCGRKFQALTYAIPLRY